MGFETLRLDIANRIAWITVARPEKRNALSMAVRREIIEALGAVEARDDVRVVVFAGEGEKAFVAGADIAEFAARSVEEQQEAMRTMDVFSRIAGSSKPTIAMIQGFALGGGCELALACDIRIGSENARLGQPEINLGLMPGGGGTQRLPRLVGRGAATKMILTGEIIDADEAFRIGLLDMLVPEGELRSATETVAASIADKSPSAVRLARQALQAEGTMEEGLSIEKDAFLEAFGSADGREGVRAFIEKRRPNWT